jgi:uncharacterized protein
LKPPMGATVQELGPQDSEALRGLLARDVAHNLYLLGLLEDFGVVPKPGREPFAYWGRFRGRELVSAIFVGGDGGLLVPSASEPAEIAAIAEHLAGRIRGRACLGDAAAVEAIVRILFPGKPRHNVAQRLFSVSADDLGPFTNPTLRLAVEADLPRLLPLAAECVEETLRRDPMAEDPQGYRDRVLQRIRARRTYVLELEGEIVFKIDVGSRSLYGAELEAPYTVPGERRRGHATLSLGQISRQLLSSLPRVTIRVNEHSESLGQAARKVGYVGGRAQRLVLAD